LTQPEHCEPPAKGARKALSVERLGGLEHREPLVKEAEGLRT
jgi:hypothetical protein